jgi:hypothetical protein
MTRARLDRPTGFDPIFSYENSTFFLYWAKMKIIKGYILFFLKKEGGI